MTQPHSIDVVVSDAHALGLVSGLRKGSLDSLRAFFQSSGAHPIAVRSRLMETTAHPAPHTPHPEVTDVALTLCVPFTTDTSHIATADFLLTYRNYTREEQSLDFQDSTMPAQQFHHYVRAWQHLIHTNP